MSQHGQTRVENFAFLCPNGHRLNGPTTLKGKPGKCPHCGVKFIVPPDEPEEINEDMLLAPIPEAPVPPPPTRPSAPAPQKSSGHSGETIKLDDELEEDEDDGVPATMANVRRQLETEPPFPNDAHPMSHIFARMWGLRDDSSEVEIYLPDGVVLTPDYYSPYLSQRTFGVFGLHEGERYQVIVIPWESIRRVCVHRLPTLPATAFPGVRAGFDGAS